MLDTWNRINVSRIIGFKTEQLKFTKKKSPPPWLFFSFGALPSFLAPGIFTHIGGTDAGAVFWHGIIRSLVNIGKIWE